MALLGSDGRQLDKVLAGGSIVECGMRSLVVVEAPLHSIILKTVPEISILLEQWIELVLDIQVARILISGNVTGY